MLSFSERNGHRPISSIIQKESMNQELRTAIWNVLYENIFTYTKSIYSIEGSEYIEGPEYVVSHDICMRIWKDYYKNPIDNYVFYRYFSGLRSYVLKNSKWYEVYDLLEFILNILFTSQEVEIFNVRKIIDLLNQALVNENSAYRIINKQVVPITNTEEIKSIEQAMSLKSSVNAHLDRALSYLSDRKEPDYRNSIKESISAVEAICRIITNNDKATLGDCLNIIKNEGYANHEAFLSAFRKLYGYTNDAGGIRHSLLDGKENPTFGEAKFMLVACSAFVNYIWEIASEKHLIENSNE